MAQNVRDEVDIKEGKSFCWIKGHTLWEPNSQILATLAQSFPELTRAFPNPSALGLRMLEIQISQYTNHAQNSVNQLNFPVLHFPTSVSCRSVFLNGFRIQKCLKILVLDFLLWLLFECVYYCFVVVVVVVVFFTHRPFCYPLLI